MKPGLNSLYAPNKDCRHHQPGEGWHFIKKGYYRPKWNSKPTPRYFCKTCGKTFSSRAFRPDFKQKKPYQNERVLHLYAGGMTIRRIAIVLGMHKETVAERFYYVARQARKEHERKLAAGEIKTNYVQIDEQETFEHTKLKPLSIALAVCAKRGTIIEAQVATFRARRIDRVPFQKKEEYWDNPKDNRAVALEDALHSVRKAARDPKKLTIESDRTRHYFQKVKKILPEAKCNRVAKALPSYIPDHQQRKMKKPLFRVNLACALIRHVLSRMRRQTWVTTKRDYALQAHLDLYIAWNNKYSLFES